MKLNLFKTNSTKEQEGVWEEVGDGLRIKIARVGNKRYQDFLQKIGKPYTRQMRMNNLNNQTADDLLKRAAARYVLLDWENLEDDSGNPIPYSSETALELFRTVPDFYKMIYEIAEEAQLFKDEEREDSVKNSKSASSGT